MFCNAFVFPYLIYCVEVWGNALSTHIQPLIKLQNNIVRIITSSSHTTEQLLNIYSKIFERLEIIFR